MITFKRFLANSIDMIRSLCMLFSCLLFIPLFAQPTINEADWAERILDMPDGQALRLLEAEWRAYEERGQEPPTILVRTLTQKAYTTFRPDMGHVVINQEKPLATSRSFSRDGKKVLAVLAHEEVYIWDEKGRILATFGRTGEEILEALFLPDASRVLVNYGQRMELWSTSGQLLMPFPDAGSQIEQILSAPKGDYVLSVHQDGVRLWDLQGKQRSRLSVKDPREIEFLAGGQSLLIYGEGGASLWSRTGGLLQSFPVKEYVEVKGISPDRMQLAVVNHRTHLTQVLSARGEIKAMLTGHQNRILKIAFSSDGKYIITGARDQTAQLWTTQGKLIKRLADFPAGVAQVAFSPDGQQVLVGGYGFTHLFDLNGKEISRTFDGDRKYHQSLGVAFSATSPLLLISSRYQGLSIWDLKQDRWWTQIPNQPGAGQLISYDEVRFSTQGNYIFVTGVHNNGRGTARRTLQVWDLLGGLVGIFGCDQNGDELCPPFTILSPDERKVLTYGSVEGLQLWTIDGTLLADLLPKSIKDTISHTLSEFVAYEEETSRSEAAENWQQEPHAMRNLVNLMEPAVAHQFSAEGRFVLTQGPVDTVYLWDLGGKEWMELAGAYGDTMPKPAEVAFAYQADEGQVHFTVKDSARTWQLTRKHKFVLPDGGPNFAFGPDGKTVLTYGEEAIKLWDRYGNLQTTISATKDYYREDQYISNHTWHFIAVTFTEKGNYLLATLQRPEGGAKRLQLWDLGGQLVAELAPNSIAGTIASMQEAEFLLSQDYLWQLRPVEIGTNDRFLRRATAARPKMEWVPVISFSRPGYEADSAEFTPDRRAVLTNSTAYGARLWSLTGQLLADLGKHERDFYPITFSPDEKFMLSSSTDGTAKLWNLQGEHLATFDKLSTHTRPAQFSPDGAFVYMRSLGGGLIVWPMPGTIVQWLKSGDCPYPALSSKDRKQYMLR